MELEDSDIEGLGEGDIGTLEGLGDIMTLDTLDVGNIVFGSRDSWDIALDTRDVGNIVLDTGDGGNIVLDTGNTPLSSTFASL